MLIAVRRLALRKASDAITISLLNAVVKTIALSSLRGLAT
jgi:hypothetical protein